MFVIHMLFKQDLDVVTLALLLINLSIYIGAPMYRMKVTTSLLVTEAVTTVEDPRTIE